MTRALSFNLILFFFKMLIGLSYLEYNACPLCGPRLDARWSSAL